jgi:DNA repair protein RecO
MIYKTKAIIISSTEVKEYDRFYGILSAEHGKKTIVAKGVRKITAKLACGLEPITCSEIFLAEGRSFDRVTGAIIDNQFCEIKKDLDKIKKVRKFFKIIDWLLIEKSLEIQENKELFEGLIFYLELLEKKSVDDAKIRIVELGILWKIIYWLGFQPQIFHCFNCSEKLQEQSFYQMILPSGIVCNKCLRSNRINSHHQKISKEILKILRIYNQKEVKISSKLKLSSKQCNEIRILTILALDHILGRRVDL